MNHPSNNYGVYHLGGGQIMLSTMTVGVRCFDDNTVVRNSNREILIKVFATLVQTVRDHRPLVLMLVLLSAVFGYTFLTLSSLAIILLLAFSLRSRKGTL